MTKLIGYYGPPPELNATSIQDARTAMLGIDGEPVLLDNYEEDYSAKYGLFSDYMAEFERAQPDLYLFPTYSSFPLVDAVRGYHAGRNLERPQVDSIKISRTIAMAYEEGWKGDAVIEPISTEIKRLFRHVGKRAVLIDQYVASGATMRLAKHMLNVAGVSMVGSTDEAQWYLDAELSDDDKQNMTSRYARDMHRIGREAAEIVTVSQRQPALAVEF